MRLTDPRRFGALLFHRADAGPVEQHPLLAGLGVEPLSSAFSGELLYERTRSRAQSIKQVLLAGDIVVGVGNIYASESLFRAAINPKLPARRLGRRRCEALAAAVREVLTEAIAVGGSTLRDFVGTDGGRGYFCVRLDGTPGVWRIGADGASPKKQFESLSVYVDHAIRVARAG